MAGYGLGFGAHSLSRQYAALSQNVPPSALSPSTDWDGSAGSGFNGMAPLDPIRTSAKPVCRLLTPPNQYFTEELVLGVWAGANQNGSLLDDLGIEKVIAHCEGRTFEINAPSFYLYEDSNGNPCKHLGWYVVLQHPGSDGHLQVYFEAVPKDTTMQNRVIGPYQFSPQSTLHDFELEVAATPSEIVGERYTTILRALNYLTSVNAQNPLINVSESFSGDIGTGNLYGGGEGYCTITASEPVIIRKLGLPLGIDTIFRPRVNGLWFKGENITFDFFNASNVYHEVASQRQHVFDGVTVTDTGGRYYTHILGSKPTLYIARGNPWYLECDISILPDPCANASLVRGCKIDGGNRDVASGAACVVGNQISNWSSHEWRAEIASLTVQYIGSANTAALELVGANDTKVRTFTAYENGTPVGSFTIDRTVQGFLEDTHYTVGNVVDWLNTLPGWVSSILDNSRHASALSLPGINGAAFSSTDVKTSEITLVTMFDEHGDLWQPNSNSLENTVFADNLCFNNVVQSLFLKLPPGLKDCIILNNAFDQNPEYPGLLSQISSSCSHVVVAHNSWSNQALFLRIDIDFDPDSYCLIANNVLPELGWTGPADPDLTISNNHIFAGSSVPSSATGTSIGGTTQSLMLDPGTGNFAPLGALLITPKPPIVRYDIFGVARGIPVAVGAVAGGGEVAPTITSSNPSGTYAENVAIGGTLTANKPVTWSVSGADASALMLNSETGDWTLEPTDFETKTDYEFSFAATDDSADSVEQIIAIAISDLDEISPVLSGVQDAATGPNAASLAILTDEGNGTLFWYLAQNSTPPEVEALVSGIGAAASGFQPVEVAGVQNVTITGLAAGTSYFAHFMHRDGAGNESEVLSGDGFSTEALPTSSVSVESFATVYNGRVNSGIYTGSPFTCSGAAGNVVLAIVTGAQAGNQSAADLAVNLDGAPMALVAGAGHSYGFERPISAIFSVANVAAGSKIVEVLVNGNLQACTIMLVEIAGLATTEMLANVSVSEGNASVYSHSYTPNAVGNLILSTLVTRRGSQGPFTPDDGVFELLDESSSSNTSTSSHTSFAGYVVSSGTTAIDVGADFAKTPEVLFLILELNSA